MDEAASQMRLQLDSARLKSMMQPDGLQAEIELVALRNESDERSRGRLYRLRGNWPISERSTTLSPRIGKLNGTPNCGLVNYASCSSRRQ